MGKSKTKIRRATYRSLLEWKTLHGFADEWLVMVKGNPASELLTLNEIQDLHYRSPRTPIHVLNNAFRDDGEAEWLRFRELDLNAKEGGGWAAVGRFWGHFSAAVGTMLMALFAYALLARQEVKWGTLGAVIFLGIALTYAAIRMALASQRREIDQLRGSSQWHGFLRNG